MTDLYCWLVGTVGIGMSLYLLCQADWDLAKLLYEDENDEEI